MFQRFYHPFSGTLRRYVGKFIDFSRFYGRYVANSSVREIRSLNHEDCEQKCDDDRSKEKTNLQGSKSLSLDFSLFSDE